MKQHLIENYLLQDNLLTFDPYDIWKTNMGLKVKKIYYKHKYLGLFPAGIFTLYDFYINNKLRFAYTKQEYPVVRAQAAMALINLYKKEKKIIYIEYAKKHIDWLKANSSTGYSGYCWGTGFDIIISDKLTYDKNVPFSTNTPYILEVFYEYYKINQDENILEIIKSIYQFYEKDLLILQEDKELLITSYGPFKDRVVTNAVSYTMFAYAIFYEVLGEKEEYIKNKIHKMYNFLTKVQEENGSWFYAPYDDDSFIDCFHSAFVLKNIIKTERIIALKSNEVVSKGYGYIKSNFYDTKYKLYNRFSISNKPSIIKFDLYDNAEMLYLSKLMGDSQSIKELEEGLLRFIADDRIYSIIDLLGFKKNKNTLRWAVMPYLLAKSFECKK